MSLDVAEAGALRLQRAGDDDSDSMLQLLLANYQRVTADPRKMGYLRFLLKHYAKSPTPWRDCMKDNLKRFGPKTPGLCGVLKDIIRQRTDWRHGSPAGPHPGHPDAGSPGVAIGEADAPAAPPFGGHHKLKLADDGCELDRAFAEEFGEHTRVPYDVLELVAEIAANCNVKRVLLELDQPPIPVTV